MIALVRGLVVTVGFGVLALLGLVELVLSRRSAGPVAAAAHNNNDRDVDVVTGDAGPPLSRVLSRVRTVIGVLGVAMALYGVYLAVRTIPWTSYLAIAIWLAAAVILHDAVLVPAVSVLRGTAARAGRRLPPAALILIEGAFVVVGVVSLVAVPAIWAKHLGPLNPTVLPGSYGTALVVTWLVVAVVTAGSVAVLAVLARRQTAIRLGSSR